MLRHIYAIYDIVSGEYTGPVVLFPSDAAARRMFGDVIQDGRSEIAKHPIDFELHAVGSFDQQSGKVEGLHRPRAVCSGAVYAPGSRPGSEIPGFDDPAQMDIEDATLDSATVEA